MICPNVLHINNGLLFYSLAADKVTVTSASKVYGTEKPAKTPESSLAAFDESGLAKQNGAPTVISLAPGGAVQVRGSGLLGQYLHSVRLHGQHLHSVRLLGQYVHSVRLHGQYLYLHSLRLLGQHVHSVRLAEVHVSVGT